MDDEREKSREEEKTEDYNLALQITRDIDERLERRLSRNSRNLHSLIILVGVLILPIIWLAMQSLIKVEVEAKFKQSLSKFTQYTNQISANLDRINKKIDLSLLQANIKSDIIDLKLNAFNITPQATEALIKLINKYSDKGGEKDYKVSAVTEVALLCMKHQYGFLIKNLQKKYPEIFSKSEKVNEGLINYYGLKIMSSANLADVKDSRNYKAFNLAVHNLQDTILKGDTLAMRILVSFQVAGNKANPKTKKLLLSIKQLHTKDRALVIWHIIKYSDPSFWTYRSTPRTAHLSETVKSFMVHYKTDLLSLSDMAGMKDEFLHVYQFGSSQQSVRLGKFILYWLYKVQS